MKIIKYILLTIISIVAIALIAALFIPKTFHAEGNITINQPIQVVYDYVKLLKTQENYSEWFKMDSKLQKTYKGIDGTEGASITWQSDEMGNGKQVIKKLIPPARVEIDLHLMDENADPAFHYYDLKAVSANATQVKIAVDGTTPYPWNLMTFFYDMSAVFQKNAENLKKELEK